MSATVVTLGFGSLGSVNRLPTLGYSMPSPVPTSEGIEYKAPGRRLHAVASGEPLHAKAAGERLHFVKDED